VIKTKAKIEKKIQEYFGSVSFAKILKRPI
jgi:hypothetical protein